MGRRSINTTKSGKYMNPTDRARKEARRKELKKNKKQRMAVRQAVLKSKDAIVLLEEASLYDRQEYDPKSTSSLSERVLQEKRKKLMETFERMITLYKKEDPDKASELQAMKDEYDRKRNEMIKFYDQVKLAERVKATEIPLPDIPPQNITGLPQYPGDIPLPPGMNVPPHPSVLAAAAMTSMSIPTKSILKKTETSAIPGPPPGLPKLHKKPVAPPPTSPDELSDISSSDDDSDSIVNHSDDEKEEHEDDYDDEDDVDIDGEEIDDKLNSIRNHSKKIRFNENKEQASKMPHLMEIPPPLGIPSNLPPMIPNIPGPFLHPSSIPVPAGMPPPVPMVRAPGLHPNPSSIAVPPQMFSLLHHQKPIPPTKSLSDIPLPQTNMSGVTATPVPSIPKKVQNQSVTHSLNATGQHQLSTIEAKPQLKNLIGDSTKLVPTSLRLRKSKPAPKKTISNLGSLKDRSAPRFPGTINSKDDAYDQFMKEMEGLL